MQRPFQKCKRLLGPRVAEEGVGAAEAGVEAAGVGGADATIAEAAAKPWTKI